MKLSTTIGKIESVPNMTNKEIIYQFLAYMKNNGSSERHQNNNLTVMIEFANYFDSNTTFYEILLRRNGLCLFACALGFWTKIARTKIYGAKRRTNSAADGSKVRRRKLVQGHRRGARKSKGSKAQRY